MEKSTNKKTLIIAGARQIGKTTSIREFGKTYSSFIEINFITMPHFKSIFSNGYNVVDIIKEISLLEPKYRFIPNDTLILFDEIQAYPDAVTSLKPFAEDKRFDIIDSSKGEGWYKAYYTSDNTLIGYFNSDNYQISFT